jgi:predicted alpha/beta hydrolase
MPAVTFPARDGYVLGGTLFEAASPPRAAVVVAGAMGVPRGFYDAFAAFLTENGLASLTFDYRGVGGSRPPGRLSAFRAALHEWGEEDLAGALDFMARACPGVPLVLVGHSVGGQLAGLAANLGQVAAMLFVASQSGYWRLWPWSTRWQLVVVWHVVIPALSRALGYLPMRRLGGGADVPAGVAIEWARWARHPRYVLSWADARPGARFATVACPLRAIAVADDRFYAPRRAVQALVEMYPRSRSETVVVSPADAGAAALGHFGYFRKAHRATLWPAALRWIEDAAGLAPQSAMTAPPLTDSTAP